ncbi:MAG TPA: CBS domain-containing protein [Dongiaceae bacterium]|nr:CBS domain-containing protein [Dongiaceae bacterium]
MRVREIMRSEVEHGTRGMDLASAAMIMWRQDCGIVPILDERERIVGVITDRDICMAVTMGGRPPGAITVDEVMSAAPHTVRPDSDVRSALGVMRDRQIRRLPVTDAEGRLRGMLSLSDVVLHLRTRRGETTAEADATEILRVLHRIVEPRETPAAVVARS